MDNHYDGLLLHVDREAYSGLQYVTSMAEMVIFWNRNYCVEFLNEIISYCGKSENILAHNLMVLLSSVDILSASWLWSIMNIAVAIPMCLLASCKHKMKEYR